jgi:hypothetical protein
LNPGAGGWSLFQARQALMMKLGDADEGADVLGVLLG